MLGLEWPLYFLLPTTILLHLFIAPYTKVEESFNIQAVHDILIHGIPTENVAQFFSANYDHVSFPGSVPRTFTGALVLSGLSRPWVGLVVSRPAQVQMLVRGVLGLLNAFALVAFARSVKKAFGVSAAVWYTLFQASQFHVMYYSSRTLPNMFAFIFSNLALRSLLNAYATPWSSTTVPRSYRLSLYLLTIAGIIFRSELAILVATLTIYLYLTQRIPITGVILPAATGGLIIGLTTTVSIDSFFWQSLPLWPEWAAFYYNTIQGHSADWGVSPWHFYFANAIPRLMLNPATYLLCIPLAVLNGATRRRSLDLLVPLLSFVGFYSILPHKEWRFIVYVVPGLTAVAAVGASWIWTRRAKSAVYALLSLALVASVFVSFAVSTSLLVVSSLNYPGGEALSWVHARSGHQVRTNLRVYIDNLACQTGVTRFLENHEGPQTIVDVLEVQDTISKRRWVYDKTEDPEKLLDPLFWYDFDYVLAERPEKIIGKWGVDHIVYGFSGVKILKPGEEGGADIETQLPDGWERRVASQWTSKVAAQWKVLEAALRDSLLRGWWLEIRMEPKIRILSNKEKSSPDEL